MIFLMSIACGILFNSLYNRINLSLEYETRIYALYQKLLCNYAPLLVIAVGTAQLLEWNVSIKPCVFLNLFSITKSHNTWIKSNSIVKEDNTINRQWWLQYLSAGFWKPERRKVKTQSRRTMSTKGGYMVPLIVQSSGVLAKMMRVEAEHWSNPDINVKVIWRGRRTMLRQQQRANPTAPPYCYKDECWMCQQHDTFLRCQPAMFSLDTTAIIPTARPDIQAYDSQVKAHEPLLT